MKEPEDTTIVSFLNRKRSEKKFPLVMGIVNCTPDSFYSHSRGTGSAAVERALRLVEEGADIIDFGGESTRPGSDPVSAQEEMDRLLPVIQNFRSFSSACVSIDTRKADVAREAIKLGANWINDVSAGEDDESMLSVAAEGKCGMVLMHMKGKPATMQDNPSYDNILREVFDYLRDRAEICIASGISRDNILLDPGIGFGKRYEDNIALLRGTRAFADSGFPVLLGLSRKSYLQTMLGKKVEDRLAGTLASHVFVMQQGASCVRVHDVAETCDARKVIWELSPEVFA